MLKSEQALSRSFLRKDIYTDLVVAGCPVHVVLLLQRVPVSMLYSCRTDLCSVVILPVKCGCGYSGQPRTWVIITGGHAKVV
jgi:hypothetical protein